MHLILISKLTGEVEGYWVETSMGTDRNNSYGITSIFPIFETLEPFMPLMA